MGTPLTLLLKSRNGPGISQPLPKGLAESFAVFTAPEIVAGEAMSGLVTVGDHGYRPLASATVLICWAK